MFTRCVADVAPRSACKSCPAGRKSPADGRACTEEGGGAAPPTAAPTAPSVFRYAGRAAQAYVVPAGVTAIRVKMWGAAGGGAASLGRGHWSDYRASGGPGGFAGGVVAVTPGESLTVVVGQGGNCFNWAGSTDARKLCGEWGTFTPGEMAAFPDGGQGNSDNFWYSIVGIAQEGNYAGGGGGRSSVLRGDVALLVAGGGGGAGGRHFTADSLAHAHAGCGGKGGGEVGGAAPDPTWDTDRTDVGWYARGCPAQGGGAAASASACAATAALGGPGRGGDAVGVGSGGGGGGYIGGDGATDGDVVPPRQYNRGVGGGGGSGFLHPELVTDGELLPLDPSYSATCQQQPRGLLRTQL
jgi:hypothetical protein